MRDTVSKNIGLSRTIKGPPNLLTLYPTWEAAAQAMIDGTFPIDLGPLNPAGVQTMGTELNKANLLSDETAAKLSGLPADPTVDAMLAGLTDLLLSEKAQALGLVYGTRSGTGNVSYSINTPGITPQLVFISSKLLGSSIDGRSTGMLLYPSNRCSIVATLNDGTTHLSVILTTWNTTSISIRDTSSGTPTNASGETYDWVAIGKRRA